MRGLSTNEQWRLEDLKFGYGLGSLSSGMGNLPQMFASDTLWMISTPLLPLWSPPKPLIHRAPASAISDVPGVPRQHPEATGAVCPLPFPEGQFS